MVNYIWETTLGYIKVSQFLDHVSWRSFVENLFLWIHSTNAHGIKFRWHGRSLGSSQLFPAPLLLTFSRPHWQYLTHGGMVWPCQLMWVFTLLW